MNIVTTSGIIGGVIGSSHHVTTTPELFYIESFTIMLILLAIIGICLFIKIKDKR